MFNFLNSTALFAAIAALIPLLIHLFSKRRVKVVEFSSLKHLKAMQKRQVRRLRIRQWLLLLLRMLIILAVVLAFARPTTTGGYLGSHATVSAVILFDNSASMNRYVTDGNLFELARNRAEELLSTFGESDEVSLIPLDRTGREEQKGTFASAAIAREKLERLRPGNSEADLDGAIETAINLLDKAANLNKEIYIITDRQHRLLPDRSTLDGSDAQVYLIDLPVEENDNCGVTAVDFGGQLIIPGHEFNISATVKNYGVRDCSDIIASLYLDGNRIAQTDVVVAAGRETTVRFNRSLTRGGFHSGCVEISDDKFPGDNRYFFSFHIPEKFNVLIIDNNGSGRFIALALVPSSSTSQYWSVKKAQPDELGEVNLADFDVIVLADTPQLGASYVRRIKSFVREGKSLFVTYGGTTDIKLFNANWSDVTGVTFDEPVKQDFTRAGYYTFQSFDIDHPVFSVFRYEKDQLPEIKFYTLPKHHLAAGVRTLASFSGLWPALVEASYDKGKVLTFCAPIAPPYSDLTGHAFFVPFIARVAEYLASNLSSFDLRLFCGDKITRTVSIQGSFSYPLELITPDSSGYNLVAEEGKGSLVLRPTPTDQPGIYRISYIGREVDRFAVNINPAECDLSAVDVDQLAAALGATKYHLLNSKTDLASAISETRFGKELWQVFLWVAVIFLMLEMLLSRGAPAEE
ncbi:MAG: BatA domain-containing protein [Candidatus Zixiibacteriota bacterium]